MPIKNEKHEVVLFLASHKELNKDSENNSSNDEDEEEDDDDLYSPVDEAKSVSNSQYQRRRSRAVLYQLSGHYRKSVTMKSKLKLNNVSNFSIDYDEIFIIYLTESYIESSKLNHLQVLTWNVDEINSNASSWMIKKRENEWIE